MPDEKQLNSFSRRSFLKNTGIATAGLFIIPRHVMGRGFIPPSDKIVVASVGVGGMGGTDVANIYKSGKAEIGFLCDVDDARAAISVTAHPQAKYYKDWRVLFDKE